MNGRPAVGRSVPSVSLATKVAFLSRPDIYPQRSARVDAIETHMSWVFLTDSRVYKLKKPVCYDYLDFSTVEARRADCMAEVRLNRRLAPDVYLGVVPLELGVQGLHLDRGGVPVDWLVEMRRLPADRMLDQALRAGTADPEDLARVASRLSRFYASAPRIPMQPAEYRRRLKRDLRDDQRWLCLPEFGLEPAVASAPAAVLIDVLGRHGETIGARAWRLVEGCTLSSPRSNRPGQPVATVAIGEVEEPPVVRLGAVDADVHGRSVFRHCQLRVPMCWRSVCRRRVNSSSSSSPAA